MPYAIAGKPLRYLLEADEADAALDGRDGEVTLIPLDADHMPLRGVGVLYCNLRREDGKPDEFGPYLDLNDDIWRKYKEGAPDPSRPGFENNIRTQCAHAVALGAGIVEWDNCDTYKVADVLRAYDISRSYGLQVVAKNPWNLKGNRALVVAHDSVVAIIAEDGCGQPGENVYLRNAAGKPDLPIRFVFYGDGSATAEKFADFIKVNKYTDVGVTYSSDGEYGNSIDILLPVIASATSPTPAQRPSMAVNGADIVAKARSYIDKLFDGPDVVMQARAIAQVFPDLANYCAEATNTMPWCGDFIEFVLKDFGIRPPAVKGGVGFFYVDRWLDWGTPIPVGQEQPGDVAIFLKSPHHVTFVVGNGKYVGGNQYRAETGQSDAVTETTFRRPDAIRRPPAPGAIVVPLTPQPAPLRPMIEIRDVDANTGGAVSEAQRLLGGIDVDGEFGPDTDAAVRAFQGSRGLEVDGVIGPETWSALLSGKPSAPGTTSVSGTLSPETIARITALAGSSEIARYSWEDRGRAPVGYIKGMAVMFGEVYLALKAGGSAAKVMAALPTGDADHDALAWYGMGVLPGVPTLRALFTLLIGLGMRESSGKYWEGLDKNAGFKSADETEAGLFQQSWNSRSASPELPKLFATWSVDPTDGFLSIFREGVPAGSSSDLGGGQGEEFQRLCKAKPAFAVECAAVGLRVLRKHWGPIDRHEAEVRPEADALLQQVQAIVDAVVVQPKPDPIYIPPNKPGNTMPPDAPTSSNPAVDEFLNEIRPIVERRLAIQEQAAPADMLTAYLVSRGWQPPPRGTSPLLLPPAKTTTQADPPASAPAGNTETSGARPVTSPAASTSTASTVMKNLGVGGAGALLSGLAAYFGGVSIPTAVGAGGVAGVGGLLGAYAPMINGVINALSTFRAGREAQKAKAAP